MVTLKRPGYFSAPRNAEYCGLSTDNKNDKSILPAENGDEFYEMDTKKVFIFNAISNEWIEQPDDTTAVDTGLPPMSTETIGHFLSNDGSSTHWQTIASSDFIITLTEGENGTYTADKTYVEIKTAYDAKENIAVAIGNSRLPLMSAEIADNGDAGFTFGYTQVTTGGQMISTRAVNCYHTADPIADEWADADQSVDYTQLKQDTASKSYVDLYANSGVTVGLADGVYLFAACDERHRGLSCVYVCGTTSTVFDLSGMAGWSVAKNSAKANAIYINNTLDVSLTVYITAIGQGSVGKFE